MDEKLRIYQNVLIFLSTGKFEMNAQTAQELGKAMQQISGDIENMKKIQAIAEEEAKTPKAVSVRPSEL